MLKLWQVFADKVLQKIYKNKSKEKGNQVRPSKDQETDIISKCRVRSHIPDNIPAGPESKIALLAGARFRVCLEKSECFR